jgi:hypothetical protein
MAVIVSRKRVDACAAARGAVASNAACGADCTIESGTQFFILRFI